MAEPLGSTAPIASLETDDRRKLFEQSSNDQLVPRPTKPIIVREVVALLLLIGLSDLSLYRSQGFAGPSLLYFAAPLLLCLGRLRGRLSLHTTVLAVMLILLAARLVWCGSAAAVMQGLILLSLFTMSIVGLPPFLTRAIAFTASVIAAGACRLADYWLQIRRIDPFKLNIHGLAVWLPLMAVVTFASLFVMANPDLVDMVEAWTGDLVQFINRSFKTFDPMEVIFCLAAGWMAAGALCTGIQPAVAVDRTCLNELVSAPSPHYAAYRNTLYAVIGLFVAYLMFEFSTLWFKIFPLGFHYSGYAHEGAAWLTVALGVATLMLSLIFRGSIIGDPRLQQLRTLAWIWSVENLLLAVAVFNRLFIYIGFNGMTRMRVVGMLGVASVVVGFLLVVGKIAYQRNFSWLIQRQLWTVAVAMYLYVVLPVDAFVNLFNVGQIMHGHLRPSVQICIHPTTDEGLLCLQRLLDCPDEKIRAGICAMLSTRRNELKDEAGKEYGWTAWQLASERLARQLDESKSKLQTDLSIEQQDQAWDEFRRYTFQWY